MTQGQIGVGDMSNAETAAWIREWVNKPRLPFGWPTDGCGYGQHIKFVEHRNAHWTLERSQRQTFNDFCLEYAASLEAA